MSQRVGWVERTETHGLLFLCGHGGLRFAQPTLQHRTTEFELTDRSRISLRSTRATFLHVTPRPPAEPGG
jgi:hypothetical protein